jgi:predicted ABC-type ATPase
LSQKNKRLRVIAGPNGTGKTTLYFFLKDKISTGIWLNADEILEQFTKKGFIEYSVLGFKPTLKSFESFCKKKSNAAFLNQFKLQDQILKISFGDFSLMYSNKFLTNELAAFLTNFFRYFLVSERLSITTETVLSHPSKLEFVKTAKKASYKTYLYFIGTNSPEINIQRINSRVIKGGHAVPIAKIKSRYKNSIAILKKSVIVFNRVYIFDNSENEMELIASYCNGNLENCYTNKTPNWLNFLLVK